MDADALLVSSSICKASRRPSSKRIANRSSATSAMRCECKLICSSSLACADFCSPPPRCLLTLEEAGTALRDDIHDSCSSFISSSLSPPHGAATFFCSSHTPADVPPADLRDGEPFPSSHLEPLKLLWQDPGIQACVTRGTNAALPEKCVQELVAGAWVFTDAFAWTA